MIQIQKFIVMYMPLNLFVWLWTTTLKTFIDQFSLFDAYTPLLGKVHVLSIFYFAKNCKSRALIQQNKQI